MTAIQLINTIEISPYDYANQEYESPKPSGWEDPEAWHQYWIQCISDKGLDSLKPIEPGSYFVDIQTIGDAELEMILQTQISTREREDLKNQALPLLGGIFVFNESEILLEPMCCCDLSHLAEWQAIYSVRSKHWERLWIGHPWVFYRVQNHEIEFYH